MRLEDLQNYTSGLDNLDKIEVKAENDTIGHLIITETKETYVFEDEETADDKVNDARQNPGFASATKKYKAGKIGKDGTVKKPETWTVVVKLSH